MSLGLTENEIGITTNKPIKRKIKQPSKRQPKYKFIDENNNEFFWSGLGKTPTWLEKQIQNGKSREDFLIKDNL